MENQNNSQFGERMSIEQFMEAQKCKQFNVYPRMKDGKQITSEEGHPLFYFAAGKTLGYVPSALGSKLAKLKELQEKGETPTKEQQLGDLFITTVTTPGYNEPMFMLCESRRESVFTFSLD